MLLQKEFEGYRRYYGIDKSRAVYLPWKVNLLSVIGTIRPGNEGYVFAGA
ncbi:MAG: hypothetical protein IPK33_25550 [Gemmatimonadetes bacterium]|nr:hypothetical protein [Gemmatimonadota bacterium]